MTPYDRGFRPRGGYWTGDRSEPGGYAPGGRGRQRQGAGRPWTGGHPAGYQGGPGGVPSRSRPTGRADDWWLASHYPGRYAHDYYDRAYQDFDRRTHPQYSPVGGTYPAMGGTMRYGHAPRPLREDMWFSDWTRWF